MEKSNQSKAFIIGITGLPHSGKSLFINYLLESIKTHDKVQYLRLYTICNEKFTSIAETSKILICECPPNLWNNYASEFDLKIVLLRNNTYAYRSFAQSCSYLSYLGAAQLFSVQKIDLEYIINTPGIIGINTPESDDKEHIDHGLDLISTYINSIVTK